MKSRSNSIDEAKRLEGLRDYGVLDTLPEEAFDDLTALAADICEAPISLITLIDEGRQWFKSEFGLDIKETSRTMSFCAHAIEQPGLFIVPDATRDDRFAHNPLVTADPNIRFYAGAPLVTPENQALGTLCVIDREPREMKPKHQRALWVLSRHVMALLELRRRDNEMARSRTRLAVEKEARSQAEEQFKFLAETVPHIIWAAKPDGTLEYFNQRCLDYFQLEPRDMKEWDARGVVHPEDQPESFARWEYSLKTGEPYEIELRLRRASDGTWHWHLARALPQRNERGEIAHWFGSCTDIHARKEAEAALKGATTHLDRSVRKRTVELEAANESLRRERNLSDQILNSLPGIFYLFDEEGRYLRWNTNFEKVSGCSAEEIPSRHPLDFIREVDQSLIAERMKKVFETGQSEAEAVLVTKDGREVPYYFTGLRIEYDGRPCLIGMGIDISERRQLEEQFRQVQKLESIGRLAAGVAHDFNNILTVQEGYASMLISDPALPSELVEPASHIASACERAAAMTRQLLLFSRKQVMLKRRIDISHVVGNFMKMLDRLLGKQVKVDLRCECDVPTVYADPGMMEQIVMNLAVNARDAMPEGGILTIGVTHVKLGEKDAARNPEARQGNFVCIEFTDTGFGISPEVADRIFEPFFTTKDAGRGTGLGLATVYGIVKQHEGWIEVESAPDAGASFKVFLPGSAEGGEGAEDAYGSSATSRGTETILFVEGEQEVRKMVEAMLTGFGYRVFSAVDGPAALEVWRENAGDIDLLLADLVMPKGMTGAELAERLRRDNPGLKVVFTSGYGHEIAAKGTFIGSGSTFLQKPYRAGELGRVVRDLLDAN